MKDLEIRGVPYSLMTDGWWLTEEIEPAPQPGRGRIAADLLLALLITLLLCVGPKLVPADLAISGASLPR